MACEYRATACDIKITLDMLWIGVNCIFYVLINTFFKLKNILSKFS